MGRKSTANYSKEQQGAYVVHVVNKENDINYVYVGSGFLADRVSGNPSKLRRNQHENPTLQEAYNKFLNCYVEVSDDYICNNKKEARELEDEVIKHFKMVDGVIVCNDAKPHVEKQYKRVLDAEKVCEIRILIEEGKLKQYEIAAMYGVEPAEISKIKTGRRWVNVIQGVDFD